MYIYFINLHSMYILHCNTATWHEIWMQYLYTPTLHIMNIFLSTSSIVFEIQTFFFFWGAPQTHYAHTACCGWISWCWLWNSNLFCFFWSEPLTLRYIHIHVKLYNLRDVTSSSTLQLLNCTLWMGLPVDYYQLWKGKLFGLKVKYWTWDDIDRAINWKAQDAVSCSTTPTDPQ